jgi:hypothetical protein
MFSLKNKKQSRVVFALALFLFSSGIFAVLPHSAHAWSFWGFAADAASETIGTVFKGLLYGIFLVIGLFTSMAITLFEWAAKPEYISGQSGLLNRGSVYEMWKFIRDFFNLFFILTLLYTAFTIVFQVAKNYKQTLLSIILAAMFVNFSFPITRVLIDMTNVPMYYFVNQLGSTGSTQKDYLGTMLSASQIQKILIPGSESGGTVDLGQIDVSRLLMGIIFLFVFTISLLVLAILFVVRLVALIMLLVFSSVGFAASVIPGMEKYGSMWWEKLAQYALFGPAAMFMLVIATRFFAEIAKDNTSAQFLQSGIATATPATAGFVSSMAMFVVPIIMLWFAIGMAVSSSIIGAGAVVGLGYAAIKGTGKALAFRNPISTRARGLGMGMKEGLYKGKLFGLPYGQKIPGGKFLTGKYYKQSAEDAESKYKGIGYGGREGKKNELQILHEKRVNEALADRKKNRVTRSANIADLSEADLVTRQSAALALAEDGDILTGEILDKTIQASADKDGNYDNDYSKDLVFKMISKAKDGAVAQMSKDTYAKVADNEAFYKRKGDGTREKNEKGEDILEDALETLNDKLKKEGKLNIRVDYQMSKGDKTKEEIFTKLIKPLAAEDLVKQTDLHKDPDLKTYFMKELAGQSQRIQKVLDKAVEKGKPEVQKVWVDILASGVGKKQDEGSTIEVVNERTPRSRTKFENS